MTRTEQPEVIRFPVIHRLLHWVIMIGFTSLAVTGFSLKFSSQTWAQWVVALLGGPGWTGYWHRCWAVITYSGDTLDFYLCCGSGLQRRLCGRENRRQGCLFTDTHDRTPGFYTV